MSPEMLGTKHRVLTISTLLFSGGLLTSGGALLPCYKAVSSSHGNYLVVIEGQFQKGQVSLQIFPTGKRGPDSRTTAYWEDFLQWTIVGDSRTMLSGSCPLPLVTDDGNFVVLLARGGAGPLGKQPALQIYSRGHGPGAEGNAFDTNLVKTIFFSEIWPSDKLEGPIGGSVSSVEWFQGDAFEFSSDDVLMYKPKWGPTIRIRLVDGSISRR